MIRIVDGCRHKLYNYLMRELFLNISVPKEKNKNWCIHKHKVVKNNWNLFVWWAAKDLLVYMNLLRLACVHESAPLSSATKIYASRLFNMILINDVIIDSKGSIGVCTLKTILNLSLEVELSLNFKGTGLCQI